jgi:ADP-heptose:LPS heptosyltransferase
MVTHTLVVRLDSAGDVLLAGPAVRAVAAGSDRVTMLAGPLGEAAARLLPGVDEVLIWHCPWIAGDPPPVRADDIALLVGSLAGRGVDRALVLTSFHQSPLPTALVLRLAGVPWIGAFSEDYPGALLDLRHQVDPMLPEAERGLSLARAAGYDLPSDDGGWLAVRRPLPDVAALIGASRPVVLHPGTSVPARAWPVARHKETAARLSALGYDVVVTGSPAEARLTAEVCDGTGATDLGGRTTLAELAAVLARAAAVVVANTGPAHLAAAVGTAVVSLFAPTVPARRWAPYGVPLRLLGDQDAACRQTRSTICPVPGHPCLTSVTAEEVVTAVEELVGPGPARRDSSAATVADPEEVRA